MIKNAAKSLTLGSRSIRRGIFGGLFGGKKKEAHAPSIVVNREKAGQDEEQPFKKQVITKEEEMFMKKRDALLDTLAKQRDTYDTELVKRRRDIETASVASKREFEITVANLDYNRVIYDSTKMDAASNFETAEELLSYLSNVLQKGYGLTEEKMMELIRGFIHTADQFAPEDMQSKEFAAMMDLIRQNFAYFTDSASYEDTTKFLDVFSVDYPEAWAKIEQGTLKKKNTLPPQTLAAIIRHFSNQGEGTDRFYDQMETAIQNHFSSMSLKEGVIQSYFNVRRGTNEFIEEAFKDVKEKIATAESVDIDSLTKLALMLTETKEMLIFVSDLMPIIESKVLQLTDGLTLKQACLIGAGFGPVHGSQELFTMIENKVADTYSTLDIQNLRMVLHGLVFNNRISKNLLKALRMKFIGLQNSFTPVEMAKIITSYHQMRINDKEVATALHDNILLSLQNHSNLISDEDLLEIFKAMCISRCGTREMHKTIEYILSFRLERLSENRELLDQFYEIGNKSGLITPATLQSISQLL